MNPSGGDIRNDRGGSGHYGAPRKRDDGSTYTHRGVDYSCRIDQKIWMPCTGKIIRDAYPYHPDHTYHGVMIEAKRVRFKMFYVRLYDGIVGKVVKIGEPIGIAENIALRYPGKGVTPHIHVGIVRCDPEILFN